MHTVCPLIYAAIANLDHHYHCEHVQEQDISRHCKKKSGISWLALKVHTCPGA